MLIVGAKGHAKEILDVLHFNRNVDGLIFFDNISNDLPEKLFDIFPIIRNLLDLEKYFYQDSSFALGIGGPAVREMLCIKMQSLGGKITSVISNSAIISEFDVSISDGVNIMHHSLISNGVSIGQGVLVNAGCLIHHDVLIGEFCEISPGAIITGNVRIGRKTIIGSGAVIRPKVNIGNNVIVGAGAVVVSDVKNDVIVAGVPAKVIGENLKK